MNEDENVLYATTLLLSQLYYYMILRKKSYCFLRRYKRRRWWVRSINNMRSYQGDFMHLFQELKYDVDIFFKYTRMNKDTFNLLLSKVRPYLQKIISEHCL